jgi:photosystem II stability/assembly factor-like uncharacterized protein
MLALLVVFSSAGGISLAASPDSSGWEHWDEGLPSFASVMTIAAIADDPGTVYAGAYTVPGLWRSTDDGVSWESDGQGQEPGPHNQPVFALLYDAEGQRLWAGTSGGLFSRSVDSSLWSVASVLDGPVFSLALDGVGRLYAVNPDQGLFRQTEDESWVLIRGAPDGLVVDISPSDQSIWLGTAGDGLWKSHDGGETWQPISDLRDEYISALLTDCEAGVWAYASPSGQMYHSQDQGDTWRLVPQLKERVYAFALAADGTLYLGLDGRVARSEDGGKTWVFGSEGLCPQVPVLALKVVRQSGGGEAVYAGTRDGVYRSTDGGLRWQRHLRGLGAIEVNALAWDGEGGMVAATPMGLYRRAGDGERWQPVAPDYRHKRFYDLSGDALSGTIYAGMQSGLVRSADGGDTWREVDSELAPQGVPGVLVDPEDPDHLFIRLAFERIYESHDGGRSWKERWAGMETHHEVLSMARSPSGEFLAGNQEGLFRWDRQSRRWQRESLSLDNQSVFAIAFPEATSPADPGENTAYVGATNGLWCRRSGGEWQRCGAAVIRHTVTALAALPNGHVFAGTRYAGLYRSCDRGDTWHRISDVPSGTSVNAVLADVENGMVYVATDQGVFRGEDDGCPAPGMLPAGHAAQDWGRSAGLEPAPPSSSHPPRVAVHTLRADDALLRQAKEIGFSAVVQVLSWEEIEPTRGEWHWEYPDSLARAAHFYGLDLILRLDHPPEWASREGAGEQDLPFDEERYLVFVGTVARRYRGGVQAYIIWNEPNLASEWGASPDPAAYTRLLQGAYRTIKQEDPFAQVVSAGLSSTNGQNAQAMDDRLFLERMYQAGARPSFDALGAHPYGFAYPPDDPHGAHQGLNLNRIQELRAIMDEWGDEAKPVWAAEGGWTTHGVGEHAWLTISPQEQADYLVRAWEMTRAEFPWLHIFTVWNLAHGLPQSDEKAGYSILRQDGAPKPAYEALRTAFASDPRQSRSVYLDALVPLLPDPSPVFILARDEEVHLGDSE